MAVDRDDFFNASYWDEFYADDDEAFDWYSSEEWLADVIGRVATEKSGSPGDLTLLDIGCGTSPLLFTLVKEHGFRPGNVVGGDFSKSAIEVSAALAEESGIKVRFEVVDATEMGDVFQAGQFDFVVDKGCLDCFISSDATSKIDQYMKEVRRILKPDGMFFVLPVNAADIPRLLTTGEIHLDEQAMGPSASAARESWTTRKRIDRGDMSFVPPFEIQSIRAQDEKHLFCLEASRGSGSKPDTLNRLEVICNQCQNASPLWPLPVKCLDCDVRLRRFALS